MSEVPEGETFVITEEGETRVYTGMTHHENGGCSCKRVRFIKDKPTVSGAESAFTESYDDYLVLFQLI